MPYDAAWRLHPLLARNSLASALGAEEMMQALNRAYAIRYCRFAPSDRPFLAIANRVELDGVTLHYCRYDTPVEIGFSNMAGYRQFLCLSGSGEITSGGRTLQITRSLTTIVPPGDDFDARYGSDFSQLVLQFDEAKLQAKYELMEGYDPARPMALPIREKLAMINLVPLRSVALALSNHLLSADRANAQAISALEDALFSAFLFDNLSCPVELEGEANRRRVRSQAERVRDYIDTNWTRALTVEVIAKDCDLRARTVFSQFKAQFGSSPMIYLRNLRLDHARDALRRADEVGVLAVALACGFTSFGHFARHYKVRFGELPSETLSKRPPR